MKACNKQIKTCETCENNIFCRDQWPRAPRALIKGPSWDTGGPPLAPRGPGPCSVPYYVDHGTTGSALRENDCNSILGYNMIIKIIMFNF